MKKIIDYYIRSEIEKKRIIEKSRGCFALKDDNGKLEHSFSSSVLKNGRVLKEYSKMIDEIGRRIKSTPKLKVLNDETLFYDYNIIPVIILEKLINKNCLCVPDFYKITNYVNLNDIFKNSRFTSCAEHPLISINDVPYFVENTYLERGIKDDDSPNIYIKYPPCRLCIQFVYRYNIHTYIYRHKTNFKKWKVVYWNNCFCLKEMES